MSAEIKRAAQDETRAVKICGAPRTGKTETLVRRAALLLESGVEPSTLWIEVSSGFAADELRTRLAHALPDPQLASEVVISRVLDVCQSILADERALAITGIRPRLLTDCERKFLLEDMKTTGVKNRQLRSLLRLFARKWAALEPEKSWLAPGEPSDIMNLLTSKLRHIKAMLPEEAAARCAHVLMSEEGACLRHRFSHVLADDFQNLSRAEQTVVCYCAKNQLVVAGNPSQTVPVATDFPYPEGFDAFEMLRHNVSVHTLTQTFGNREALKAALALSPCADEDESSKPVLPPIEESTGDYSESLVCIRWDAAEEELNAMTKYLRALLDDRDVLSRTYVVAPNKTWARQAVSICHDRGFKVDCAGISTGIGGDPREVKKAKAMIAYFKLALLAAPKSPVAWRCWCGLGNYLLNSDAWMHLEEYADERGIDLVAALSRVASEVSEGKEPFLRSRALASAWESGQELIARDSERRGFSLMRAIGAEKLPEFADINRLINGDETARDLFDLVYQNMTNPRFSSDEHCLRFITLERLCGLTAENLVVLGCVNGFVPKREAFELVSTDEDRDAVMNTSRRTFASALAKAEKRVLLSYFAKADLEFAEKTKLQVARVRSENGTRIALVRKCCFIDEMHHADPGTTGGQQFLGAHGIS